MRDLPRGTQVVDHGGRSFSPTGLSPSMACRSRAVRLTTDFLTPRTPCRASTIDSYNPHSETAATYRAELGLRCSPFARHSPKLFAACHVLHRLLAPRHPPRALCSLTPSSL